MSDRTYKCDHCHGVFEYHEGWDAEAEAQEVWKEVPQGDDRAMICDVCYQEFMGWMHQNHPEALR